MSNLKRKYDDDGGFPESLEGFGYAFNSKGQLRSIKTGESFLFEVRPDDRLYNQAHYERLGEVLNRHVYNLLVTQAKLTRIAIPLMKTHPDDVSTSIFASPRLIESSHPILLLIHGSGVVRAGQWARRLLINNSLDEGSMLPYIALARRLHWHVLVANTNDNSVSVTTPNGETQFERVSGNETPELHLLYLWDNFLSKAASKEIMIVAHSYGGIAVSHLLSKRPAIASSLVGIAFTDSVHSPGHVERVCDLLKERAVNFVTSNEPLNKVLSTPSNDCEERSAGHTIHEFTSHSAMEAVFQHLAARLISWHQKYKEIHELPESSILTYSQRYLKGELVLKDSRNPDHKDDDDDSSSN